SVRSGEKKTPEPFRSLLKETGGEGGIRTLETGLFPSTRFPVVLLRPARTPLHANHFLTVTSIILYRGNPPCQGENHPQFSPSRPGTFCSAVCPFYPILCPHPKKR